MRNVMEKQTIDQMFASLWFGYPTDLCRNKRGGKTNAARAFKKINPDQAEFYRMMENMKAQIRHDRKDPDADRWPFVSSYLNQKRFDDIIESETERMDRVELRTCINTDCEQPVHGSKYKYCADHIPNAHSDLLATAWKQTGLKYGSDNFVNDCRLMCRQGLNKMVSKMDTIK